MSKQKNIVEGSISHVGGNVRIGDEIHYHPATPIPKELTIHLPKIHPDDIIGREDDLVQLHHSLCNQKRVVLVNGLGGIGKTTLAQVYISRYYNEYHHIVWITQNSEDILSGFINASGLIQNLEITPTGMDPEQLFTEIIRKLKAIHPSPCLLIIDNAERSLKKHLTILPSQPGWHLLVTSREEIPGLQIQALGFLDETQAIALFKKYYPYQQINDADIQALVKTVDYHTLTIEILAKTAAVQRYDAATLQQALEKDLEAGIDNIAHSQGYGTIERITTYLQKVFNLGHLEANERWVMKQFACLPPTYHSYALVKELLGNQEADKEAFLPVVLSSLVQKGWLLENKETGSYKMHRIIAAVVKKEELINSTTIATLVEVITKKLSVDQAKDNPADKFAWIPYGMALLAVLEEDACDETASLRNNLGLRFREFGNYAMAKELLEKTLQFVEQTHGANHSSTASVYSNLALVYQDQGNYAGAKLLLEKAVQSNEKNFGPDHSKTAMSYSNLAMLLKDMGEYAAAKKLLEKTVRSDEKNFGPDHPYTTRSYSNLSIVLKYLGEYHAAKKLLEKAVKADEKTFGPDHPNTITRYSSLAQVLQELGEYATAKKLLEKALQSDEKNFGPDHPNTAASYANLAYVLQELEEYAAAKILLEKALQSDEKNFGPDHPNTATSYSNLALVLQDLEDYAGAKTLLEKTLRSDEKNYGPNHPNTGIAYSNLAAVLQDMGDYRQALILSGKALAIFKKSLPPNHPHIIEEIENYEDIKDQLR